MKTRLSSYRAITLRTVCDSAVHAGSVCMALARSCIGPTIDLESLAIHALNIEQSSVICSPG